MNPGNTALSEISQIQKETQYGPTHAGTHAESLKDLEEDQDQDFKVTLGHLVSLSPAWPVKNNTSPSL